MPLVDHANPLVALGAALLGWLAGLVSAAAADRLGAPEGDVVAPRGPLLRDPFVQIGVAGLWAALVWAGGVSPRTLAAAVLVVPLVQVAVTDIRFRWVYAWVALPAGLAGVLLGPLLHAPWPPALPLAFLPGLLGAGGGYLVFLLLHRLGRLVYRGGEPLGRGDVTIAGMVGAIAGPHTPSALVLGIFASGLAGLLILIVARDRRATMPYGPGLCLGALLSLLAG